MYLPADPTRLFGEIHTRISQELNTGQVANYIPELGKVPADKFGVSLQTITGGGHHYGDARESFSIQSIAKVLSLVMVYRKHGERPWQRVGVEPSGGAFNSLVQLEQDAGIPRNPMLNAGALVVCDLLLEHYADPKTEFLSFLREGLGIGNAGYDERVAQSELATGHRNEAVVQFMRSYGNIRHPLADIMDLYCHICALALTCNELAEAFLFLANGGVSPATGRRIVSASMCKRVNAIMQTCGFYDEAGEFAFSVGLPGKSGVGGGIVAIHPGLYSIAVWSPPLNAKGNSTYGFRFLEQWTTRVGTSIF